MPRKYSVEEIDRMRDALTKRHPIEETFHVSVGGYGDSWPTEETHRRRAERSARVEDELRTYMQNGTEPDELDAPDKEG